MKITQKTIDALHELVDYKHGKKTGVRVTQIPVDQIDVRVIRENLRLTQEQFADLYGFPIATIRNWEQGRRQPEGPAKILLKLIQSRPDVVADTLHSTT